LDYLLFSTLCQARLERSKSFGPGGRFARRIAVNIAKLPDLLLGDTQSPT
jgi:hypothetical protein